jgi:hypothetical protein
VRQSGSPKSSPSTTSAKHALSVAHTEPVSSSGRLGVPAVFPFPSPSESPPHDVTANKMLAKQLKRQSFWFDLFMDMASSE